MRRTPRLCFLNPPHPYLRNPKAQAPLGLLYVAASARVRAGAEVSFVDMTATSEHISAWKLPDADIYGITGTCLDCKTVNMVAAGIKAGRNSSTRVVVGGPLALSEHLIDRNVVDAVVVGEGEVAILEIIRDWPRLQRTYKAARIQNLDELPFPARDLLVDGLGENIFANRRDYFEGGSTVISTSRGCPSACYFCAAVKLWGRKITRRSIENVTEEIREIIDVYGVRQLRISDENLTCSRVRLYEICEMMKNADIAWRCSIRVKPNDKGMFLEMVKGGCKEVGFGIESGDQAVLSAVNKGTTVKDNKLAVINAKQAGLVVRLLMMAGCPGETVGTVDRNISFLRSVEGYYDSIALMNFTPLFGTRVEEAPAECGCEILSRDVDKFNLCAHGPDGPLRWENHARPVGLTLEELTDSKNRMREYCESTGLLNVG